MYLPMNQIIVFYPIREGEDVSNDQLKEYIFEKRNVRDANHIGKRTARRGDHFISGLKALVFNIILCILRRHQPEKAEWSE